MKDFYFLTCIGIIALSLVACVFLEFARYGQERLYYETCYVEIDEQ